MLNQILKRVLPRNQYRSVESRLEVRRIKKKFVDAYLYDLTRYTKYSDSNRTKSENNLISLIIREYHVVEKGLTMPETRLGFGKKVLLSLIENCLIYSRTYGKTEQQLLQAISVVFEYEEFHYEHNFELDDEVLRVIGRLKEISEEDNLSVTNGQKIFSKDEYFGLTSSSFERFSRSRASIRNYSEKEVPVEQVLSALELAKFAPSACNRQAWRTYVFTEKSLISKILETQGGNRGFGHLANKLIVIAAETGVFSGVAERNQAFIDGGIYAMNLLYSLHYNKIAACILNCSNNLEKDRKLRTLTGIKDSEVFIALVSCGNPPETFKAAASIRYSLDITNKIYE